MENLILPLINKMDYDDYLGYKDQKKKGILLKTM
jgi:hypothetical protein